MQLTMNAERMGMAKMCCSNACVCQCTAASDRTVFYVVLSGAAAMRICSVGLFRGQASSTGLQRCSARLRLVARRLRFTRRRVASGCR